jgi:hypothetical protein
VPAPAKVKIHPRGKCELNLMLVTNTQNLRSKRLNTINKAKSGAKGSVFEGNIVKLRGTPKDYGPKLSS